MFSKKVLELVKKIPEGRILTYKDIACALGSPKASRAVGNALNKNPNPINIPCHRVVCSDGSVGGYVFGTEKKIALLRNEGVDIRCKKVADFEKRSIVIF